MPKKKSIKKVTKKATSGKRYTTDEQHSAARRVVMMREPIARVARDLGCSPISVTTWVKNFKETMLGSDDEPATQIETQTAPASVAKKPTKKAKRRTVKKAKSAQPAIAASNRPHHANDERIEVTVGRTTIKFPQKVSPAEIGAIIKQLDR